MSKYVSTRLEKIEKLGEKLNNFNNKINYYIQILKDIKNENDIFDIHYTIVCDIESNQNIKHFKNFFIQFDNNYSYGIFPRPYFEREIPDKFKNIIDIIKNKIDLNDFHNSILDSIKLYKEIDSIYYDIKLKYGNFALNSKKIIDHFKEMIKFQITEEDDNYFYGYFSMRKDNNLEVIDLVFKNHKSINNYGYQIKFPLQEEINKIYNQIKFPLQEKNNKIYNQMNINNKSIHEIYIDIFKQEFIRLNKNFCELLNIGIDSIVFDFFSQYTNFNINYSQSNSYSFYINFLDNENMDIIVEKINLEKQLNNF